METKLTVIVDNIAANGLTGEWGLSILAEYGGKKILVDAGASELFAENMKKLGFDMAEVDCAVLSHAHYDHANGLPAFLRENQKAEVYLQESVRGDCYFKWLFISRYIGIPKELAERQDGRIVRVSGKYELMPGAFLLSHSTPGLDRTGAREKMYLRTAAGWRADDFSHEQSLILETDKGLVIVNSCSHGSAVNIINEAAAAFPGQKVYGLIGGFHLYNKKPQEVREAARKIRQTGIEYVCTGHCTKERAYNIMKEELGDRLHQLQCGLVMTF